MKLKTDAQDKVAEFATMMGHANLAWSPKLAILRAGLVAEEAAEYLMAAQTKSRIDMADALADLKYVILGAGVVLGVQLPDDFDPPSDRPWESFSDKEFLYSARKVHRVSASLVDAILTTESVASALRLADSTCAIEAAYFGLPLRELFNEVHRSNMTKAPANEAAKYSKIGKGPNYQPPDLERILASQF